MPPRKQSLGSDRPDQPAAGAETLRAVDLADLIEAERADVLSVSLDVDPSRPEHQGQNPAYRIWLRNALRQTLEAIPKEARRGADELAQRVLRHVETNRPRGKGLALFAAPGLWREYVLPVPLTNRAQYGRPDVVPVLWAVDEYEPYAILAVDREHARILIAYLGRTTTVDEETLELDTSDWRFKAGRQPSFTGRGGMGAGRGAQRDTFDSRVDDHVRRFWARVAEAAARTVRDLHIERLIIGGPDEAANAVRDLLPEAARQKVVGLVHLPARADRTEIQHRTLTVALAEEHHREADLVAALVERVAAGRGAVLGTAATMEALKQRRAHTVVLAHDLEGDRAQMLPLLARRSGARIELIGDSAAQALRAHEGIGAILRQNTPSTR